MISVSRSSRYSRNGIKTFIMKTDKEKFAEDELIAEAEAFLFPEPM